MLDYRRVNPSTANHPNFLLPSEILQSAAFDLRRCNGCFKAGRDGMLAGTSAVKHKHVIDALIAPFLINALTHVIVP